MKENNKMELITLNYRNRDGDINETRIFFEMEDAVNAILEDLDKDEQLICLNVNSDSMYFRSFWDYGRLLTKEEAWEFEYYFEFTISTIKVEGNEREYLARISREADYRGLAV
jgi:hypothetical protein